MNEWRLPTLHELFSVFDHEQGKPKVDGFISDVYWSSTTHAYHNDSAWIVCFSYGGTAYNTKSKTYHIRCVREGHNKELEWAKTSSKKMTWYEACEYCKGMNNEK